MKRIFFAFAAAAMMLVGCTKELEQRVDQLENDVEQIKSGLEALKAAVENKLTVEDYNQIEGGYELLMSDGTKLYIYNGADGAKGDKGDKGDTGAQGPQGEKGDKGDKGDCNFEIGITEPTQSGTSNDIYLDIETGTFYRFNKS